MKTLGEERVRIDFNVSGDGTVDKIKRLSADLINICEENKDKDVTHGVQNSEKTELYSLAQRAYEEAAMWAVKAATASMGKEVHKVYENDETLINFIKSIVNSKPCDGEILKNIKKELFKFNRFKNVMEINILEFPTFKVNPNTGDPLDMGANELYDVQSVENLTIDLDKDKSLSFELNEVIDLYSLEVINRYDNMLSLYLRCSPRSIKSIENKERINKYKK